MKTDLTVMPTLDFTRARKYRDAAKKSQQICLAFHALLGAEIENLRKIYGVRNGDNQHQGRVSHGGKPFLELLEEEVGVSKSSAYRYDQLWQAIKPRLNKLNGGDREKFEEILSLPLDRLSGTQYQLLEKAVHKLTDGKSFSDMQQEFDLFKGDNAKPRGGHHPRKGPATDPNTPQQAAIDFWAPTINFLLGRFAQKTWADLPDEGPVSRRTLKDLVMDLNKKLSDAGVK